MQVTLVLSLGWEDPRERAWLPIPVFLPGEAHGQRSLVGYRPWGHRIGHDWEIEHTHFIVTKTYRNLVWVKIQSHRLNHQTIIFSSTISYITMLLQSIYGIESKANHLWIITVRCSIVNISRVFKASIFFPN